MRILKDIIEKLDGYDTNKDYFEFTEQERDTLACVLWEEVYGGKLFISNRLITLSEHYDLLVYLVDVIQEFEKEDEYEICDVMHRLINITDNKIQQIDKEIANPK